MIVGAGTQVDVTAGYRTLMAASGVIKATGYFA